MLVFAVVGAALVGGVEGNVLLAVEGVELLQDVVAPGLGFRV